MSATLHAENEQVYKAAMEAKRQLREMVLDSQPISHSEIDRLREIYFTNLARHQEITRIFESERQAEIARRQAARDARRAEAATWSKQELMERTGLTRKDRTRAELIESYASMAG